MYDGFEAFRHRCGGDRNFSVRLVCAASSPQGPGGGAGGSERRRAGGDDGPVHRDGGRGPGPGPVRRSVDHPAPVHGTVAGRGRLLFRGPGHRADRRPVRNQDSGGGRADRLDRTRARGRGFGQDHEPIAAHDHGGGPGPAGHGGSGRLHPPEHQPGGRRSQHHQTRLRQRFHLCRPPLFGDPARSARSDGGSPGSDHEGVEAEEEASPHDPGPPHDAGRSDDAGSPRGPG